MVEPSAPQRDVTGRGAPDAPGSGRQYRRAPVRRV